MPTFKTNVYAMFWITKAAVPHLRSGAAIINTSSVRAYEPSPNLLDYAQTKSAIVSFTKSLAVELGPRDITVNCVAPGWVDTEMVQNAIADSGMERISASIPLGRIATADDIAGPIVFLCSPMARHITGEVLNVNGGSVLCG